MTAQLPARPRWRRAGLQLCLMMLAAVSAGCSLMPQNGDNRCATAFEKSDRQIASAGARDSGPTPIPGFRYLRTDRFLASFRDEVDQAAKAEAWIRRLADLDRRTRRLELRNAGLQSQQYNLDACREQLVDELLRSEAQLAQLSHRVRVPDDYVTAWQILGLAPLTALPVSARIALWHRETRTAFATASAAMPSRKPLLRWYSGKEPGPNRSALPRDALGIPFIDGAALDALFERHAPVWEVEQNDDNDRIGTAVWHGRAQVDPATATEYRRLSFTRYGGQTLLQLNYIVWFRSRPGNDIYAGNIDGLTWRVTLGPEGAPLLYDSIHNCGCYHLFFPTPRIRRRPSLAPGEPPLVLPSVPGNGTLVVRLDSGRHFIRGLYRTGGTVPHLPLATASYDRLRSLPADPSGPRSFFGVHGIVAGSERPERFLLWPMGVRSPGAMRQWGHHATAFVGRRHFDDPFLIERLFEEVKR
ncbi:hypothetical protein GCM10011348_39940 [Marinobacterium nitratireducens]|uniref:Uncharacterized protein n=1 Tax=Marinobacterium nitratireducens TaxID=518897 RepID=A0A918DXP1_9GAMM|nr:hypothetical protein [Marinobacterium nitratireducens]GGO87232.1 hypothetical protein GCM10011348_39940 [Marinobacterium nitratireducens]